MNSVTRIEDLFSDPAESFMECVVCNGRMGLEDLDRQEAIFMTGDVEDVIFHKSHIEKDGDFSSDYAETIQIVAYEYGRRQGWQPRQ